MSERDVNAEGLEKSFASNVLGESQVRGQGSGARGRVDDFFYFCSCPPGVYILTKSLIPLIEKSADPRVVSPRDTKEGGGVGGRGGLPVTCRTAVTRRIGTR